MRSRSRCLEWIRAEWRSAAGLGGREPHPRRSREDLAGIDDWNRRWVFVPDNSPIPRLLVAGGPAAIGVALCPSWLPAKRTAPHRNRAKTARIANLDAKDQVGGLEKICLASAGE